MNTNQMIIETEIKLRAILVAVCQKYGVKIEDVKGRSRLRKIVAPRQVYFYLAIKLLNRHGGENIVSLSTIGKYVNRDHATAIHSEQVVQNEMDISRKHKADIEALLDEVNTVVSHRNVDEEIEVITKKIHALQEALVTLVSLKADMQLVSQ